jgi:ParB family transcriptional regulator, chromosome partitioning protein
MDLQHIPLSNLKIATVNVRHSRKAPDISDILPSVRERGVLQPLLVRPNGKGFEIIAGRRRYFAASKVAEEKGVAADEVMLPCAVTAKGDDAGAMEASLIENVARAPMDELEEYEAYARLLRQGRKIDDIARTFGVADLRVRQRLAIAGLHSRIKEAFRAGDIAGEDLRLLTAAGKGQQKQWVDAFVAEQSPENDGEQAPRGHVLKRWLFGAEQITTKVALFPLDQFAGEVITDLFGDVGYFTDHDAFWSLQNGAIARLRDDLLAKGWQQVSVMDKGERFHAWEYREVAIEDGGHVFVEVRGNGEVNVHAGYREGYEEVTDEDNVAVGSGAATASEKTDPVKPELTRPAENYVALHRHAIVRAELLPRPGIALRLAVAHMIAGSPLWSVRADRQRADKEEIAASVAAGAAQAAFETERKAVLELLELEPGYYGTLTRGHADGACGAAVLARLLQLPDEAVLRVLTLLMAETLCAGTPLVEAAGAVLKPDVARWWAADDTFLELVRDRGALNAMLTEVAGKEVADANVSESGKVKRKILRDCLNGEGRDRSERWMPRYMAFPSAPYDSGKTVQAASDWEEIRHLFVAG